MSGSNNKTISIPSKVGFNSLVESFGKISLSTDVKEMLGAIGAELNVSFNANTTEPLLELRTKTGKTVCTLEEFKKLFGYRRFIIGAIKEADKTVSSNRKIDIVSFLIREALSRHITPATRVVEQNLVKFNEFGVILEVLKIHYEAIDQAIDNEWKTYLLDKLERVNRILTSAQIECLQETVIDRDYISGELFRAGVPKWIYNKFLDRNFTNNLSDDCETLLFPKNNYLNSIAMTTIELADEQHLSANHLVVKNSGGIIELSQYDYSRLFPGSDNLDEQVETYINKYQWTLSNTYAPEQILAIRIKNRYPPVFREAQAPKQSGKNPRPETELAKLTRQISNTLGRIQATWNGILNFVIPTSNPDTDFWTDCYPNAANWEVTPTRSMYHNIDEETSKNPLVMIRSASSEPLLRRIGEIVSAVSHIPSGSAHSQFIVNCFTSLLNKQKVAETNSFDDTVRTDHPLKDVSGIETRPLTDLEIETGKAFLNFKKKKTSTKRVTGATSVRLNKPVIKILAPLKAKPFYNQILDWLSSSFKTGERNLLQKIAAEYILGEALKHQETIFPDEDLEDLIDEVDDDSQM